MNSESSLLKATLDGDIELVHQLLKNGVNPNCKDGSGRGPLLSFYPEIIKLLIDFGALPMSSLMRMDILFFRVFVTPTQYLNRKEPINWIPLKF